MSSVTGVQGQVAVSMIRKSLDFEQSVANKLFAGLDAATANVQQTNNVEPGKGQHVDLRI